MIARKNKSVIKNQEFVCETGVTSNEKEIANAFNNCFINIVSSLAKKKNDQSSKHTFLDYMKGRVNNSIFLEPILESEILNIVSNNCIQINYYSTG